MSIFKDANGVSAAELALTSKTVWFDENDTATAITPIAHVGGATNTFLTNDAQGPFSQHYDPVGKGSVWDAVGQQFDFSSYKVGDIVGIRFDGVVTTSVANQEYQFRLALGIGDPSEYEVPLRSLYNKSAGAHSVGFYTVIYIGNELTRDNPAKIRFTSDDNASIVVNGWWTPVTIV